MRGGRVTYLENKDLGLANEGGAVVAIEVPTAGAREV